MVACLLLLSQTSWAVNEKANNQKVANEKQAAQANSSNLEKIKQKIQALAESLSLSKNAHDSATGALKTAEIKISESRKKLRELQEAQQKNKQSLDRLWLNLLNAQHAVNFQRRKIADQLRAKYMKGRAEHLQLLLQQQDPNRIARELHYLGYITKARRDEISKLEDNLRELARLEAENAAELRKTSALAQQYADTTKQLEQEKAEKALVVSQLSKKIESQEQQLQRLKRDEQNLAQLMKRLSEQAAKREQAQIARAKEAKKRKQQQEMAQSEQNKTAQIKAKQTKSSANNKVPDITDAEETTAPAKTIATNDAIPEYAESNANFSQLRGTLRLPVRGSVINRFGSPRSDTGVTWKGIFIRAVEGNEVKAVAKGRVVFADWMRGFGNLIIVDHGSGYMSLYGNNESLFKSTGQSVKAGDTIASVGNSGGSQESGVYYELRRNSAPFDPLSWSSLR